MQQQRILTTTPRPFSLYQSFRGSSHPTTVEEDTTTLQPQISQEVLQWQIVAKFFIVCVQKDSSFSLFYMVDTNLGLSIYLVEIISITYLPITMHNDLCGQDM